MGKRGGVILYKQRCPHHWCHQGQAQIKLGAFSQSKLQVQLLVLSVTNEKTHSLEYPFKMFRYFHIKIFRYFHFKILRYFDIHPEKVLLAETENRGSQQREELAGIKNNTQIFFSFFRLSSLLFTFSKALLSFSSLNKFLHQKREITTHSGNKITRPRRFGWIGYGWDGI